MAYAFDDRPAGTVRTVLAVEADHEPPRQPGRRRAPARRAELQHLGHAPRHRKDTARRPAHRRGRGLRQAIEGWLAVSREFDLPPGVAQARVVVRDEFLGRVGALTVRFVVPTAAGLRISTPVLTDRVTPAGSTAAAQPVLLARREFPAAANLYCQFQVFGAAESSAGTGGGVEASYELRPVTGTCFVRERRVPSPRSADGRLVRLLAFTLDGMKAGDYELVLRVEDKATGQTQERVEPLRIAAFVG